MLCVPFSSEGYGRLRFYRKVRENLKHDHNFRAYFEGETNVLPKFYTDIVQKDLGIWWQWLPPEAMQHDQNAYLNKTLAKQAVVA